jgi:hypothetical protein
MGQGPHRNWAVVGCHAAELGTSYQHGTRTLVVPLPFPDLADVQVTVRHPEQTVEFLIAGGGERVDPHVGQA